MQFDSSVLDSPSTTARSSHAERREHSLVPTLLSISKTTRALMGLKLAEIDLHQGQDELLAVLSEDDAMRVSELANRLSVRASTISKMMDRLAEKGLVERRAHPRDGRITMVLLTPAGREMQKRVAELWLVVDAEISAKLPQTQAQPVFEQLNIIDDVLRTRLMRLR